MTKSLLSFQSALLQAVRCGLWVFAAIGVFWNLAFISPSAQILAADVSDAKTEVTEKTKDFDWCTVVYPEKVIPGQNFSVKITPKKIPDGQKIGGDIHHAKANAYIGFAAWGGNPKPAKSGETLTFTYKMTDYRSDDQGCQPIFYLTNNGWNEATFKAPCPVILPLLTDEIRKTFKPDSVTFKKSWLSIGTPLNESGGKPNWKAGEKIVVPFEYYVDPSDDWGKTQVVLWVVGPWIDCPDGKYAKNRTHVNYGGCGAPDTPCVIGKRTKSQWTLTLPKPYADAEPEKGKFGDSLLLIAQFRGNDGKFWPWQQRAGLPCFSRSSGYFDIDASTTGNLFTYDQKVVMRAVPMEQTKNLAASTIKWIVTDTDGKKVTSGSVEFPGINDSAVDIPINIQQKGTFLISAELTGTLKSNNANGDAHNSKTIKESREITFARIPNLKARIGNNATPFGGQKFFGCEEAVEAARLLGMSTCRVWLSWKNLEPERGFYNPSEWESLRRNVDQLKSNHIRPWFLIDDIPAWAITNPTAFGGQFTALPVQNADIEHIITRLSIVFKNDIIGFEWQNEIVPGTVCEDPVSEYLRFCRTANAASKWINPNFRNQIAGGLWPQTYRQSLIAAGIMEFTDILPIHYGNASTFRGALNDLAVVGAQKRVVVWDNETATGVSTWGMPLAEAMRQKNQSDYYFTRFPDELMAGCQQIVVFGGEPSPAGDWSHFWGDMSPRPSAASLAVLIDALVDATPVGEFSVGKNDSIKLFQRPHREPVMVVSSNEKNGETVFLSVGNAPVKKIDQQGVETPLTAKAGVVSLPLNGSPYLIEGGDINVLKANLVVSMPGTVSSVPTYTTVSGNTLEIPLQIHNILDRPIQCAVIPNSKTSPGKTQTIVGKVLKPAESQSALLKFENVKPGMTVANLTIRFDDSSLPQIARKVAINAVQPNQIGNLIINPGFEQSASESPADSAAADWNGTGRDGKRVLFDNPNELGHGKFVCRFENTKGKYFNVYQNIPKIPTVGGEYVYSFWIKSDNLTTGSNLGGNTVDGKNWSLHWLQVFQAPKTQDCWQTFRKRIELPEGTNSLSAAPVCMGDGWSMIDNFQLVPYEGTEYCAFAPRAKDSPSANDAKQTATRKIDGDLSDFDCSAPIPLMGRDQLRLLKDDYKWSPENCSGVAYFNYDQNYLYCGIEVIDDKHVADKTESDCGLDDSVRIAIHPVHRLPGEQSKAFCFDVSSAAPGGSGKHTLYRPQPYCGGLKSGSLAKDSSVYDMAVKQYGNKTVYEIAMPWTDLGGLTGTIGTKFGLSLQLTDNDGSGPAAVLLWGEGLRPVWSPDSFGMITLTE